MQQTNSLPTKPKSERAADIKIKFWSLPIITIHREKEKGKKARRKGMPK